MSSSTSELGGQSHSSLLVIATSRTECNFLYSNFYFSAPLQALNKVSSNQMFKINLGDRSIHFKYVAPGLENDLRGLRFTQSLIPSGCDEYLKQIVQVLTRRPPHNENCVNIYNTEEEAMSIMLKFLGVSDE